MRMQLVWDRHRFQDELGMVVGESERVRVTLSDVAGL